MKNNIIYIVTMYRWGERENHSYFIGAYTKKKEALDYAEEMKVFRGGKYEAEVLEVEIDKTYFYTEPMLVPKEIREIR